MSPSYFTERISRNQQEINSNLNSDVISHVLTFCKIHYLKVQDNNDVLSYWLCNSATLLLLLQRTLKASGAASLTPQRRRSTSASLFGRMSQVRNGIYSVPWHHPGHLISLFFFLFLFSHLLLYIGPSCISTKCRVLIS